MKTLLLFFSFIPFALSAQITVEDYEKKLRANVDSLEYINAVQANSTCGEVIVNTTDQMFSGGCMGTLVRTYRFTDECGNTARAEVYITLEDTEKPYFKERFPDVEMKKEDIELAPKAEAGDNSGMPVEIALSETGEEGKIIREWTATDRCGNSTTMRQVVTVVGS